MGCGAVWRGVACKCEGEKEAEDRSCEWQQWGLGDCGQGSGAFAGKGNASAQD